MEIYSSVRDYQAYLSEYKQYEEKQELSLSKRLEYLKQNPDKFNKEDVQKGKILLHAIDVMDEYSQSYAEDMEVVTDVAKQEIVSLTTMLGSMLGTGFVVSKNKVNTKMTMSKIILPAIIGSVLGYAVSFPAIIWATKTKVGASRKGRFEAMNNELKNPALFAILTEEQKKQAEIIAKDIQLDKKDEKHLKDASSINVTPFEALQTMKKYYSENEEYNIQKKEFNEKIKKSEQNFNKKLTQNQIRNAKHDQQLLSQLVRKMDIASQDYAENAEMATNAIGVTALTGGGFVGWVSNKLINLSNFGANSKIGKAIPWLIGFSIPSVIGVYSAKIQKQASRVGRFKAGQEMLNNPNSLVYVEKEKYEKINVRQPQMKEKTNIIDFFKQLIKDNEEYNEYRKTKLVSELKYQKAVEKINLTEKQLSDAKALQMNVFKTFSKVDEKSQTYSESVEAIGEMFKQSFNLISGIGFLAYTLKTMEKAVDDISKHEEEGIYSGCLKIASKILSKMILPFIALSLPVILIDIYTTKKQKEASRVANMLALKELEDYRLYSGYQDNVKLQ